MAGVVGGSWVPEIPPSVFADARGISPVTAMKHAELAGTGYLRYADGRAVGR